MLLLPTNQTKFKGTFEMRNTFIALFCTNILCSTHAFATPDNFATQGLSAEYTLPSNIPQIFSNVFFWTIFATCTIISEHADNVISFKVLRKSGSVDNIPLSTGDIRNFQVHAGESLKISAISGGKVELTNLEDIAIKASCSSN